MTRRVIAATLLASPLAAQRVEPIGSPYQPGIDVIDYDVRLELPDTGAFLRGDVTIALRRSPEVARLRLDLGESMQLRAVEVNGRVVRASHTGDTVLVPLAEAVGDSVAVRVTYDGVARDGLIARRDERGRWTWFGDNWPDRTRQWLPTVDHPSDKATVTWTVRAPERNVVVANGASLGTMHLTVRGRAMLQTRWRESKPIPPYLMVIAAGPLARSVIPQATCHRNEDGECVEQTVYALPEHQAWLPGPFVAADGILGLFERLVAPFPYEKLAHLQSSTRYGGMENASAIFYDGKLFVQRGVKNDLLAHEIAHQWFGDAVTERAWAHLWLSEGFANYFGALWDRVAHGEGAFRATMAKQRAKVLDDSVVARRPVIDTEQTDYMQLLDANSYEKGAVVLAMLHHQLGDSAFFRGVRAYYQDHRHGTATSDDLRVALERASGRALGPFFEQWLRRPGWAEPTVGWAYDASRGMVTLLAIQEGRFGPFALPLDVLVTDADNVEHRLIVNIPAEARAEVALPIRLPRKPKALAFDPDSTLLARISRP